MAYGFIPETRNLLRSIAATGFTVSAGPSDSTRARLNDKRLDATYQLVPATTGITIDVDLGSAMSPDTAAVLNHNAVTFASATISISIIGADNAGFTVNAQTAATATLDISADAARPKDTCLSWAPFSRRYWRFVFNWTGGSSEALVIGELVLGVATSLSRGELDGSGETERIRAPMVELSSGGQRGVYIGGPVLERSLIFADFTEAERNTLRTLWRDCRGPAIPVLWCESWAQTAVLAQPTAAQQLCLYGHLQMPETSWRWSNFLQVKPADLIIRSQAREVGA